MIVATNKQIIDMLKKRGCQLCKNGIQEPSEFTRNEIWIWFNLPNKSTAILTFNDFSDENIIKKIKEMSTERKKNGQSKKCETRRITNLCRYIIHQWRNR